MSESEMSDRQRALHEAVEFTARVTPFNFETNMLLTVADVFLGWLENGKTVLSICGKTPDVQAADLRTGPCMLPPEHQEEDHESMQYPRGLVAQESVRFQTVRWRSAEIEDAVPEQ